MDDDVFNMELRKFLKTVGVSTQREIERAVKAAMDDRTLQGNETLMVQAEIQIPDLDMTHVVKGELKLSDE